MTRRFSKVSPPIFWAACAGCKGKVAPDRPTRDNPSGEVFADLDGKPFEAYYCKACRDQLAPPAMVVNVGTDLERARQRRWISW